MRVQVNLHFVQCRVISRRLWATGYRQQAASCRLSAMCLALLDVLKMSTLNFENRQSTEAKISIFGVCLGIETRKLGADNRFGNQLSAIRFPILLSVFSNYLNR